MWDDEELAETLSPDVMRVLNEREFFRKLESAVFPLGNDKGVCHHSHEHTIAVLVDEGFDEPEREDILTVLHHHGGCCDCEVLYNVDDREEGRKAKYWRKRATDLKETK